MVIIYVIKNNSVPCVPGQGNPLRSSQGLLGVNIRVSCTVVPSWVLQPLGGNIVATRGSNLSVHIILPYLIPLFLFSCPPVGVGI